MGGGTVRALRDWESDCGKYSGCGGTSGSAGGSVIVGANPPTNGCPLDEPSFSDEPFSEGEPGSLRRLDCCVLLRNEEEALSLSRRLGRPVVGVGGVPVSLKFVRESWDR